MIGEESVSIQLADIQMKFRTVFSILSILTIVSLPSFADAQNQKKIQKQFESWIQTSLWRDAKHVGISRNVFDRAFQGISIQLELPDLIIPGQKAPENKKQSQAEFRGPSAYFSEKNLVSQAKSGRALFLKWSKTLKKIERRYGVPGHFLIAIWGRESAFGRAKIRYSAIRVLATKAFMSSRKKFFHKELLAALFVLQQDKIQAKQLKSSWAGALGQPQFLPSSYLKYTVDFDGDGRRDIWNSVPDTLASIANYLSKFGWVKGRDWGFEVRIPDTVSCAQEGPDRSKIISQWQSEGIERVTGRSFPASEISKNAMMMVPAGRNGPHFMVTDNFYVIKKYNNSDLYALFVGNLADRIAYGSGKFKTPWAIHEKLYRSDIAKLQHKLEKQGYDVGGADGLPGFKTRRSIGQWQIKSGLKSTCFPTRKLTNSIR